MATIDFEQVVAQGVETHSLGQLGMVMDVDEESGHFVRSDGALMAVLSITTLAATDRAEYDLEHRSGAFAAALGGLSPGTIYANITYLSKNISAATEAHRKAGKTDLPFLLEFQERHIRMMEEGAEKPIFSFPGQEYTFRTRTVRSLMMIAVPPLENIRIPESMGDFAIGLLPRWARRQLGSMLRQDLGAEAGMSPSRARWLGQLAKQRRKLRAELEKMQIALHAVGVAYEPVGEADLISDIRCLLYPRTGHRMTVTDADQDEYICNRVPTLGIEINPQQGWVRTDGAYYRTATLKSGLPMTWPGMLTMPNGYINGHVALSGLDHGFFTVTAVVKDIDKARFEMQRDLKRIAGGMAMPGREEETAGDNRRGLHWVGAESRGVLVTQMTLSTWADTPEGAEDRLSRTIETLKPSKITLRAETLVGPSYFFQSLPGNQIPPVDGARRERLLPDRQVADLTTLYGRSQGTAESLMLMHTSLGEMFQFSLWGGNNPCFLIVGVPGSGKSVAGQVLVTNVARTGGQVIIIDKGKSFATSTLSYGDQGLFQNLSRGLCRINVLAGSYRSVAGIAGTFIQHLATPPKTDPISQAQRGLIDTTLKECFEAEGNRPEAEFFAYEELERTFPGCWVHSAHKQMPVGFVSESTRRILEQAYDEDCTHQVYYRYEVVTASYKGQQRVVKDVRDIPRETQDWLGNQRYLVQESGVSIEVLHERPDQAPVMADHGLVVKLNAVSCLVHVATEADVQALEKSQVNFLIPDSLQLAAAAREREAIQNDPRNVNATEDQIAAVVRRRVAALRGLDAYRVTKGKAVMQREVFLGDFCRLLERKGQESEDARDLHRRLVQYYGDNSRAGFFDGPTSFKLDNVTIADFELGNLADTADTHLLGSIVGALLQHFTLYVTQEHLRGRRKVIIIDEAWQLTSHEVIARAIVNLHRTGRKHGAAVGTISQSLADYTNSEVGRQLLDMAPNWLMLEQPDLVIQTICEKLGWTPEEQAILRSTKSASGLYSQILVRAREQKPPIFEKAILILDPYEYWLVTTRPEDVAYREQLIEQESLAGLTEAQARIRVITLLAETWPRGYRP